VGILKNILVGRENGTRSAVRRRIFGEGKSAGASPESMPSAAGDDADGAVIVSGGRTLAVPKHITPPEGFEVVLHKDALEPGEIAEIIVDGTAIAICNVSGEYHAVSNACPHAGSALGKGDISGKNLRCPDHGWRFDVTDGSCLTLPGVQVPIYAVHIEHEAVCVKL
jgi:nitrite reductase/ring-hydroxylating ferredoxin subunit